MSDNNNPWDEPTRWDSSHGDAAEDTANVADQAAAPPPVPPTPQWAPMPPADAAPPSAPQAPTPPAATPTPPPSTAPTPPAAPDMPVFGAPVAPTTPAAVPAPPVVTPPVVTPPAASPMPGAGTPPPAAPVVPGSAIGSQPIPTMPPPAAPTGQPLLSGNYGGTDTPVVAAPTSSGGNGRFAWIAAIVGAVALLGGGGFFALTAFGASGGAETPEEAVDRMLVAINGEDMITIGELLDPAESRTIVEPVLTDILPELERLGVFDDSLDPADVDGVDFELADVTYRIDPIAPDLQAVYFTSGSASSEATAAEFPWGDAIRDRFGNDLEDSPRTTEEINDDGTPLVLVERDGRWYFSMWHSVAEQARLDSGDDLPLVGDMPLALGSETPAAAVEAMIQDMVDLDIRDVIGRLDPAEAAALYRYSPIFLGEAEGELNSLRREAADEGIIWSVTGMEFDTEEDGDDAIVTLRAFTVTVTAPEIDIVFTWTRDRITAELNAVIDGEAVTGSLEVTPRRWALTGSAAGESVDIAVDIDPDAETIQLTGDISGEELSGQLSMDGTGTCSEYSFRGFDADESGCLEELFEEGGVDASISQLEITNFFTSIDTEYPGIPMAAHRTDGQWYVSPTMSVMNAVTSGLAEVSREDFEAFLDDIENEDNSLTIEDIIEAPFEAADSGFDAVDPGRDIFDSASDDEPVFDDTFDDSFDAPESTVQEFSADPTGEPSFIMSALLANEAHNYAVTMQSGESLGVTLYGSSVVDDGIGDPLLKLIGPDGLEVAFNDDADGLNSALVHTATVDGTYLVEVRDLGAQPGGYQLGLELDGSGETPTLTEGLFGAAADTTTDSGGFTDLEPVSAGVLSVGPGSTVSVSEQLEANTFDVFELVVEETTQLTITVLGEPGTDVDTNVSVVTQDGDLVGYNDDASPDAGLENFYDSQLVVDVPAGTHLIEVHSFGDNDTGGYDLTIVAN